jgi:hypothetical protein
VNASHFLRWLCKLFVHEIIIFLGVHEFRFASFDKALPCVQACGALAIWLQNARLK